MKVEFDENDYNWLDSRLVLSTCKSSDICCVATMRLFLSVASVGRAASTSVGKNDADSVKGERKSFTGASRRATSSHPPLLFINFPSHCFASPLLFHPLFSLPAIGTALATRTAGDADVATPPSVQFNRVLLASIRRFEADHLCHVII